MNKTLEKLLKYQRIDPDTLLIKDNTLLCKLCCTEINTSRKSNVTQHLNNKAHKNLLLLNKDRQITTLNFPKKSVSDILCEGFSGANIPLHKLRYSSIIKMFNKLDITAPSESTVRRKIDDNYETFLRRIKAKFSNHMYYIIIDESQIQNRRFVNVILGDFEAPRDFYLIEVVEIIEPSNSKNQAIIIDEVIKKYDLSRNMFMLLISNAASYMYLCAKNLKLFYPNMRHITCFAHALHNCAFRVKRAYPNVDFLIASIKGLVVKNHKRKEEFIHLKKIPEPIVTRWGSWLDAALYYSVNFDEVFEVTNSLKDDNSLHLTNAKDAVNHKDLQQDLLSIQENYSSLSDYISLSISENFNIDSAFNLLEKISFKNDRLNLKNLLEDKMKKCDFYDCYNSVESPFLQSCLKNCPVTSVMVERSFSLLGKIVLSERRFNSHNIVKYVIFYYNHEFISEEFS